MSNRTYQVVKIVLYLFILLIMFFAWKGINNKLDVVVTSNTTYQEDLNKLDKRIDTLNFNLKENQLYKDSLNNSLISLNKLNQQTYDKLQNYKNYLSPAISDDSVCRFITKAIYNTK